MGALNDVKTARKLEQRDRGARPHQYASREDDLSVCEVCNGAEGSLTIDCPGVPLSSPDLDAVYNQTLEYHDGMWWGPMSRQREQYALLERTLPLLVRLGDFIGNGPIDPKRLDSSGTRCDLIGDIKDALAGVYW